MVRCVTDDQKRKSMMVDEDWMNILITFPPVRARDLLEEAIMVEAEIKVYQVRRIHVDEGVSIEIMYEHCFNMLHPAIRTRLTETSYTVRQDRARCRPGLNQLRAIPSTIHGMMKFPTSWRIATLVSQTATILECRRVGKKIGTNGRGRRGKNRLLHRPGYILLYKYTVWSQERGGYISKGGGREVLRVHGYIVGHPSKSDQNQRHSRNAIAQNMGPNAKFMREIRGVEPFPLSVDWCIPSLYFLLSHLSLFLACHRFLSCRLLLADSSCLTTLACRLLLDDSCLAVSCLTTLACIETMKFLLLRIKINSDLLLLSLIRRSKFLLVTGQLANQVFLLNIDRLANQYCVFLALIKNN
ncbi:hypothetical protein Tco_0377214 [Tanacetum coccineum]